MAVSLTETEDPYKWKNFLLLGLDSGKISEFTITKNKPSRTLLKKSVRILLLHCLMGAEVHSEISFCTFQRILLWLISTLA